LANFGQTIAFTATVASVNPAAPKPTGTVTFTDGALTLAVIPLDGTGHASFSTSSLSVGSHIVTASFTGTGGFDDSSGDTQAVVVQEPTSTSLGASANPAVFGQPLTFTATVTANDLGAGVPVGQVVFMDGATVLATVDVDATGHATLTTTTLPFGDHSITASFVGSAGWLASTARPTPQDIDQAATANLVTSSNSQAVFGEAVALVATIQANSPSVAIPDGTVTFKDGDVILGTATIDSSGKATLIVSNLTVGSH